MVQVYYSIESTCKSEIVSGATTLKQFCEEHSISTSRQLTIGGEIVTDVNKPLSTFADDNSIVDIVVSAKMQNA